MKARGRFLIVTMLALGACAIASEASAAPPVVCVRNLSGSPLEIVVGAREDTLEGTGLYWGKAGPHGGACQYTDVDGGQETILHFRRAVLLPPNPGDNSERMLPTATGGWTRCPTGDAGASLSVYTIRRTSHGFSCKPGGDAHGLSSAGDFE